MQPYLLTFSYFLASVAIVFIGLVLFELVTTKYRDWEEIDRGNSAVALSIGGKIIGVSIVIAFSIYHNDTLPQTLIWGAYGIVLQLVGYYVFDFLTRRFSVEQRLKENNLAVGIVSFCVSVGLGLVIGSSIT